MDDLDDYAVIQLQRAQPCFVCRQPTRRLDIIYEAPFCNSAECNARIDEDLRDGPSSGV